MHKTSVYLSAAEVARLASLARQEGRSQAEIIRRAIGRYEAEGHRDQQFSLSGVADGPGGSIADLTDDQLLEGFGS